MALNPSCDYKGRPCRGDMIDDPFAPVIYLDRNCISKFYVPGPPPVLIDFQLKFIQAVY